MDALAREASMQAEFESRKEFGFYAKKQGDSKVKWSLRYFVCDLETWTIRYWRQKPRNPEKEMGTFQAQNIVLKENGALISIVCPTGKVKLKDFRPADRDTLLRLFAEHFTLSDETSQPKVSPSVIAASNLEANAVIQTRLQV
jgi:hypothetical protein